MAQSGRWTGEAATAYAAEQRDWLIAARELLDGLARMQTAAQTAHDSYAHAMGVNDRMTRG
nr:WXG100 family type VII secretion target [Nocardia bovistercoris]